MTNTYTVEDKIRFLEGVIENIQMHGTLSSKYTNGVGGYCAVGWMMYQADVNMKPFEESYKLCGEFIKGLMESTNLEIIELMAPLRELGFDTYDLHKIQWLNDNEHNEYQRALDVQNYMKYMINSLRS